TGLYNRLSFLELGEKQLALSRRHGKESWLMFLDLNGLKEVNDKFGHENGDILLKESAYRLKHTLRISDLTARLGGDEFGVLMAGVDLEGAKKVANKIGEQLLSIEINGSQEFSGVAIGLARYNDVGSFEDFIKDADLLMYKAKNKESGASQNRVAFVDSNGGVGFVNLEQQVSQ
ncbi:GGDEF domain-containing protein, partial [Patescibacteria group bacterium]|nr:GGDEF domain-containing protein [Patescibacteria group bacterium]